MYPDVHHRRVLSALRDGDGRWPDLGFRSSQRIWTVDWATGGKNGVLGFVASVIGLPSGMVLWRVGEGGVIRGIE
ncbi:hypothetical protein BO71DRAFT_25297 [Aspergillus ellipticus CBS 707.79]|uniref:Uncharacterized protein n=1 Tax=Aspergillus ellipticus CBS 707.79 TaxID=1448320 RepID=A0A319DWB1_9EURO|nr:hypothetical protein BO71DRAFT_25297 [Aspergillus ellipticus CBS 707.79]